MSDDAARIAAARAAALDMANLFSQTMGIGASEAAPVHESESEAEVDPEPPRRAAGGTRRGLPMFASSDDDEEEEGEAEDEDTQQASVPQSDDDEEDGADRGVADKSQGFKSPFLSSAVKQPQEVQSSSDSTPSVVPPSAAVTQQKSTSSPPPTAPKPEQKAKAVTVGSVFTATFAQEGDEDHLMLHLEPRARVVVLNSDDDAWWWGRHKEEEGWVLSDILQLAKPPPKPPVIPRKSSSVAVVVAQPPKPQVHVTLPAVSQAPTAPPQPFYSRLPIFTVLDQNGRVCPPPFSSTPASSLSEHAIVLDASQVSPPAIVSHDGTWCHAQFPNLFASPNSSYSPATKAVLKQVPRQRSGALNTKPRPSPKPKMPRAASAHQTASV
eukprot:m.168678 g.168678  ORF g.168678 m.168678 type:complete len:382 (+) comp14482_c0_seq2:124-1269(+)